MLIVSKALIVRKMVTLLLSLRCSQTATVYTQCTAGTSFSNVSNTSRADGKAFRRLANCCGVIKQQGEGTDVDANGKITIEDRSFNQ